MAEKKFPKLRKILLENNNFMSEAKIKPLLFKKLKSTEWTRLRNFLIDRKVIKPCVVKSSSKRRQPGIILIDNKNKIQFSCEKKTENRVKEFDRLSKITDFRDGIGFYAFVNIVVFEAGSEGISYSALSKKLNLPEKTSAKEIAVSKVQTTL
ncbi:hypothetical protein MHBO_000011 [Bonamia ostreae]|uniref:Uncharacterized protein n=1 Tax=Bonamia ostreae TaxID=126728 RepID=A0ABV2ADY5_9EUKA